MMVTDNIMQELREIIVNVHNRVPKGKDILLMDSYYEKCYDNIVLELNRSSALFKSQFDDEVRINESYGIISVFISGCIVISGFDFRYIDVSVIILVLLLAGFNPTKIHLDNKEFSVVNVTLSLELFAKLPVSYCKKLISRINQNYVIDKQVILDTIDNLSDDDIEKKLYFLRYLFDNYDPPQQMEKLEL